MTPRPPSYGPWQSGIGESERVARLRELRALVAVLAGGSRQPLVELLTRAETDPTALSEAAVLFDTIPTRWRRRVLSVVLALGQPERSARVGGRGQGGGRPDAP